MEYLKDWTRLNKFKSTVSSVAAQVSQALPGNPIFREYEVSQQVASAGPGLAWKVFSGKKLSTKQAVSIWLFEKKQLDKWPRHEREAFPELLKKGISQLTRLRHPRLLVVERTLEESRDNFAFCTEPIFAGLANVFGDQENLSPIPSYLVDFTLLEVEIRHGLFELSEALAFLHNDARILHSNLCPASIVIGEKGGWKLAGFDFCIAGQMQSENFTFESREWERRSLSVMNPEMDYSAPELVLEGKGDVSADIYSFGMLVYALFNEGRKPAMTSRESVDEYRSKVDKIATISLGTVPAALQKSARLCLSATPSSRPTSIHLTKLSYFTDDPLLKILNCLDSLMQMDNVQKMQLFKGLPSVLDRFPKRPLLQKVFPRLTAEFSTIELIPFILPSVFHIAELSTPKEFATSIFPPLIPVFKLQRPYQLVLLLLQRIPLFLEKAPHTEVQAHVLPFIYAAITNDNAKIQELCLSVIPTIGKLVDREAMRAQLLPKLLRLILEGSILAIRVQALLCVGKLLPELEPWMVADQILPSLPKVNSKEPGMLMAILGVYKLAYESEKFGITKEQCAKSVLPFLTACVVEATLNMEQFEQIIAFIHLLLEKANYHLWNFVSPTATNVEFRAASNFDTFQELLNGANGEPAAASTEQGQSQKATGDDPFSFLLESFGSSAGAQTKVPDQDPRNEYVIAPATTPMPKVPAGGEEITAQYLFLQTSSQAQPVAKTNQLDDEFALFMSTTRNPHDGNRGNSGQLAFPLFPQPPKSSNVSVQRTQKGNESTVFSDLDPLFKASAMPGGHQTASAAMSSLRTQQAEHNSLDPWAFDNLPAFNQ